jgi:outer membrane beta-barrel protein
MRTLLLSAVLLSSLARAQQQPEADRPVLLAQAAKPAPAAAKPAADDEDEDEVKAKPAAPAKPEEKKEAPLGAVAPVPAETSEQQKLVSGAPLFNPNVAVHIVEQKAFSDQNKFEVVLFPATVQVNGKFTQHFGTQLGFLFHLKENFAIAVSGQYNWINSESAFNGELVERVNQQAQAATSLLWTWGAVGGVEVTPIYGKFAFYEGNLVHFSLVLSGGAGAGGTRHLLKPANDSGDATYGDTGVRFLGYLGGGFRVQIGKRFAIRLEVRDTVYAARVDSIDGCNLDDLNLINTQVSANKPVSLANVGAGCKIKQFDPAPSGPNGAMDPNARFNLTQARELVRKPSSDVLNNLGLNLGVSFLF